MENLIFSLNATIPIFILMVLGVLFRKAGLMDGPFVDRMNQFVFKAALPVLLFEDLANSDFSHVWDTRFVLFCFGVTLIGIVLAACISMMLKEKGLRGEFIQASYRSSAALLGIAFIKNIYGNAGMAPLMIIGSVPLYNMMAVLILSFTRPGQGKMDGQVLVRTVRGVCTNPIILGILAGMYHCQIAQCDSDITDVRDVLTKAAVLTGDGRFRFAGFESMDLDSAWLLGRNGICRYGRQKPRRPEFKNLHAEDTGNVYVRNSWSEDSHFTYLTCGPLGSGHGHADLTHISLYYKGRPFLVDSGRYSYMEEEPLRPALKSAQAHNVCVVDGESQGIPNGSWGYGSYGECLKTYYREQGPVQYCEMAYHGTLSSGQDYLVIRRVLMADPGIWLIVNDIGCRGRHVVQEYYHMDPRVKAVQGTQGMEGGWTLCSGDISLNLLGQTGFMEEPCMISETYNQLLPSSCLVKENRFTDRHTDWTCLAGGDVAMGSAPVYQYGRPEPVSETEVVSRTFTISPSESWVFLIWNQETFKGGKMYLCNGIPIYAKAAALHCRNGNTTLYRLRN